MVALGIALALGGLAALYVAWEFHTAPLLPEDTPLADAVEAWLRSETAKEH